jgi:hypothetical protein
LDDDGVRIEYMSYPAPVQLCGRLTSGEPIYLRCKYEHCELFVTDADQPMDFADWDHWSWHGELQDWEDRAAGYLGPGEVEVSLRALLARYRRGDPDDKRG